MSYTKQQARQYSPRARDELLRRKDDTATADPLWFDLQVDPDSCIVTIAGTASDGTYSIILTPVPSTAADAITVPVVRATTPASNTDIAAAFVVALNLAAAPGGSLYKIIRSASNVAGAITINWYTESRLHWILTTAETTATGTITLTGPDDMFPITRYISPYRAFTAGPAGVVEITLIPVSSADAPLPDDTDMTMDFRAMRVIDRKTFGRSDNDADQAVAVAHSTLVTAAVMGRPYRVPFNGGRLGVWLSAATNPVTSLDAVEVWLREVVE